MKLIIYIFIFALLQACVGHCLNRFTGQIKDSKTNMPLTGAQVILWVDNKIYTYLSEGQPILTDSLGNYNIKIMTGSCLDGVKLIIIKKGYTPKITNELENNIARMDITLTKIN